MTPRVKHSTLGALLILAALLFPLFAVHNKTGDAENKARSALGSVDLEDKRKQGSDLQTSSAREPRNRDVSHLAPAAPALQAHGIDLISDNPEMDYLEWEKDARSNPESAMSAYRIRNGCKQLPPLIDVPEDMARTLQLPEAHAICEDIAGVANLETYELIQSAAGFGNAEAILLSPSFPPPFIDTPSQTASASFMAWQEETVLNLETLAGSGNIDARIRLALLYSGGFPAFQDYELARLYVDEVLRSADLTPTQESAASSIRERLPRR
jgi:hypothetical protein